MNHDHPQRELPEWARGRDKNNPNQKLNPTETELVKMLRNLPLSITITKQGSNQYSWQAYEKSGEGESFSKALEAALLYLFTQFHFN